jgi:hypothetical protein
MGQQLQGAKEGRREDRPSTVDDPDYVESISLDEHWEIPIHEGSDSDGMFFFKMLRKTFG